MSTSDKELKEIAQQEYKHGFITDIEADSAPKGLSEDIVRFISQKKAEPEWLLRWRLEAYRVWLKMTEPTWANIKYDPINYQDIIYYSSPKKKPNLNSLDEVDPELRATFEKLGISLEEQKLLSGVAVDAVFDSVSVATTFKEKLAELGIIFCSFSEAVQSHPELVQKYLGSVVPYSDNFFAALNSAVFSDGSFAYIPKGVKLDLPLQAYFRMNEQKGGQFEHTLIIVDKGAVKFVVNGADIMRPGITKIDEGIQKGEIVVILEETHKKPISICVSEASSEELKAMTHGKALKNIHFVGDSVWKSS